MWTPRNKSYSVENFDHHVTGNQYYSDFDSQNDIGGVVSLRNIASGLSVSVSPGDPWPSMIWSGNYNFQNYWSIYSGEFDQVGPDPIQNLSYETVAFLSGYSIYQEDVFSGNQGAVIEGSFYISRLTGAVSTGSNFFGFYMEDNDGYDTVSVSKNPPGFVIGKGLDHEVFVPSTGLDSQLVSFRYGFRDNTGHFISSDGSDLMITGRTPGASQLDTVLLGAGISAADSVIVVGDISFGGSADQDARVEVGTLKYKSPAYDIAGDFIADTLYSKTWQSFITEEFYPDLTLDKWGSAFIKLDGATGGYTAVDALYSEDNWITTGEVTGLYSGNQTGLFEADLSQSIPIVDPENHKIKFKIKQISNDGLDPSPYVDYISVTYENNGQAGVISLDPLAGPSNGEYPVLITIDPGYRGHIKPPNDGVFLDNLNSLSLEDKVTSTIGTLNRGTGGSNSYFGQPSLAMRGYTGYETDLPDIFVTNALYNYDSQFLQSQDYLIQFPTGTLTGAYTGITGSALSGYVEASAIPGATYSTETIGFSDISGSYVNMAAQRCRGYIGNGWLTPLISGNVDDGYIVVDCVLRVNEGAVGIALGTGSTANIPVYNRNRNISTNRVKTVISDAYTSDFNIAFLCMNEDGVFNVPDTGIADFSVADLRVYGAKQLSGNTYTGDLLSGVVENDYSIDLWLRHMGNKDNDVSGSLLEITGDGSRLRITSNNLGLPSVSYATTDVSYNDFQITGQIGFNFNEWNHVCIDKRNDVSSLYVNGELSEYYEGDYAMSGITGIILGSGYVANFSDLRIRNTGHHPSYISAFDSFSSPLQFQSSYQFNTGNSVFLYRINDGTIFDSSTGENHLIVPESGSNRLNLSITRGVFADAIQFTKRSYAKSIEEINASGDQFYIAYYASKLPDNKDATVVEGDTFRCWFSGNYPAFTIEGSTFVSDTAVDTNTLDPYCIKIISTGNYIYVTGSYWRGASSGEIQLFTGAVNGYSHVSMSGHVRLGNYSYGSGSVIVDEVGLWSGEAPSDTGWLGWDTKKDPPIEHVYANGELLDTGRVYHIGVYDKEIVMPPMTSFTNTGSTLSFKVDTLAGLIDVNPQFQYIGSRNLTISTGVYGLWSETRDKICKTKSAFRIGNTSPLNAINLGFIQGPDLSIGRNLSLVDNAGNIPENYVSTLRSFYPLLAGNLVSVTGNTTSFNITGALDTDEIVVSNYSWNREEANFGAPLFYTHKIGGKRLYLYQYSSSAITGEILKLIRNNLKITDQDGTIVNYEDFPWDIRISSQRWDGVDLPEYVYHVEILSRDRYLPGKSLFVEYEGVDSMNIWNRVKGQRECINMKPIWLHTKNPMTISQTFSTKYDEDSISLSSNQYNKGPSLYLYLDTGAWSPGIHRYIRKRDLHS
jgi:hypothetical protein